MRVANLTRPARLRLGLEFALLYLALPVAFALFAPPDAIWLAMAMITVVAALLLQATPGFRWRSLWSGITRRDIRIILGFAILVTGVAVALVAFTSPAALFWLPRNQPGLWLTILLLYPLISVLPQELAYRALFFARYDSLFPTPAIGIAVNGACFALAHLFLWNTPAIVLSAFGGMAFAWACRLRRSFPLAWALHAVAGGILFSAGAGVYFYHGLAG